MLSRKLNYRLTTNFFGKLQFKSLHRFISSNLNQRNEDYAIRIPKVTIPEFLDPFYVKYEKLTAIECHTTRRKYTYGDVRKKSTILSKVLRKILKLNEGDVVGLLLPNVPEYPIASLGVLKANLSVTTISTSFVADEISRQLENSDTKVVITSVDLVPTAEKSLKLARKKVPIIAVKTQNDQSLPEGVIDFHDIIAKEVDYPDITPWDPENIAILPYSSGTTGVPKGVKLCHRNTIANLLQMSHPHFEQGLEATESFQDIIPTILPMYHLFANFIILHKAPMCGGKSITLAKYTPTMFKSMLQEHRSTLLYLVPHLLISLMKDPNISKDWLKTIRFICTAAAPFSTSDEELLHRTFGEHIRFIQMYGMSETAPTITASPIGRTAATSFKGSVGVAVPQTEIKIVDPDDSSDTALGPNTPGELIVRGPQVMKGYHNAPEETKKTLIGDGWLRTGDICYYDEDGSYFIKSRIKELIKVKGNQVSPAELESLLRTYPGVVDCAVIGIPDDKTGEVPRAYIVPASGSKLNVNNIGDYVTERVARYKRLKGGIVFTDELPKNLSGKILKREIKEKFLKHGV